MSAEGILPLMNEFENFSHSRRGEDGRSFRETAD